MNEPCRSSDSQVTNNQLRRKLEQSRQPGLKSRLDERRQAEALWQMITQLRSTPAA